MKFPKYISLFPVILFVFFAACNLQEPEITQTTLSTNEQKMLSRLMAVGDNIISGYQNAALTEKHQRRSFVALIAKQAETPDFQQPYFAYPGIGSESYGGYGTLELRYLDDPNTPQTKVPDPKIYAVAFDSVPGFDPLNPYLNDDVRNWPLPYNNLGIPGIVVQDVLIGKTKLHSISHSPMFEYILRNPLPEPYSGEYSAFDQAKFFTPTVLLCWVGMYDVLGFAQYSTSTPALSQPTPKEDFKQYYAQLMDSLASIALVGVVTANIPDILDMPYFNVVPHVVIDSVTNTPLLDDQGNPIPLIGVEDGDRVLMPAKFAIKQGYGIPEGILNGNGEPVPDDMVLDAAEIAQVEQAISDYNAIIDSVCSVRNISVVDMHDFFKQINDGYQIAGATLTSDFITGGFYSLDGIHPSDLGHALIANEWIQAINSAFRISIPPVDVVQFMHDLQPMLQSDTSAIRY